MCPSSFDGGDETSAVRLQVGIDADGVSHARKDGVSHAREDGVSHAREDGVLHAREDGDSLARENGVSLAREDAVNVCSGVGHDGRSGVEARGKGVDDDVVMVEYSALSFSFSCAESRNDVEDD